VRRYLTLLGVSLRASLATSMAYRVDFIVSGLIAVWWMLWALVPLWVVYGGKDSVAGWSFPESMLVVAWFTALRGLMEGMISPALQGLVEGIRTGTLDFLLLKPADAQFLVSTSRFVPYRVFDLGAAGLMAGWALAELGRVPAPADVAVALLLLVAAATLLYSIFILVGCASFWVVRLDNLAYLFGSIFDAARWPLQVFRGAWRVLFTFVIPLGIMTTYPAMALLGRLDARTAAGAVGGAAAFALASRLVWRRAIAAYTSASS
jgi:ABC-2 type transport system permease protein